jgi:type IV pilus assembly protein PilC
MAKFKYTALDHEGNAKKGSITADSRATAITALFEKDLRATELELHKGVLKFEITRKKMDRKQLLSFSRQMAVFLRAGISILDALEIILEGCTDKMLKATIFDMLEALRGGVTFAAAARTHPEAFPEYYLGVLEAAELTGNLDTVLDELATYISRDLDARRKIVSALFYPGCVLIMAIGTVGVMTGFVLPRFSKFFAQLHAKLPLPTRMLMAMTGFLTHYWLELLVGIVVIAAFLMFAPRTRWGRKLRDHSILRIPVIGDLINQSILERFCRTLSSMVRAGVSLPDALEVGADGTNNLFYQKGLATVRIAMLEGEGLAGPMARSNLFPSAARQMIRVGEETGTLDRQLATTADYLDRELGYKIEKFTNLFEPAVIMFMGVVVGFVAIALVSAMYGIFNQVKVT